MTIDAIRAEAMMINHVGSWQDTKHCTAIKACKKTMVPAPYTDSQADNCITASAFCPHSDTLSQTPPLDCEAWRVCIQSQSKTRSAVMVFMGITKQRPLSPSLLQNSGSGFPIDVEPCYPYSLSGDDCDCFHDMEMSCTSDGTVSLDAVALKQCMKALLCRNPNVCCSWKQVQCTDIMPVADIQDSCQPSFLEVHDTGKAEKATVVAELNDMSKSALYNRARAMRISNDMLQWALDEDDLKTALIELIVSHKADVSHIADAMHGRRQPSGNLSSAEPMQLLEDSVGGKACAATA